MSKYLIVGISGTGKTTTVRNLARRGYATVNMDDIETGISFYQNKKTGEYIDRPVPPFSDEWLLQYDWVWNKDAILKTIEANDDIFLCGDATNESDFYPLFDKIFGLYISNKVEIIRRLQIREPNRWTDDSIELKGKLERQQDEIRRMQDAGIIMIDADQHPDKVVEDILTQL